MNVKDKLEVFNDMVMKEAEEKRKQILSDLTAKLELERSETEKIAIKAAKEEISREKNKLEQAKNKEIIGVATEGKRALIDFRKELINNVSSSIIKKIEDYMETEDYQNYLIKSVVGYCQNYNDIVVIVMEKDLKFTNNILEQIKGVASISKSNEDFIGGYKIIIKEKHVIYDSTFKSKLDKEIKELNVFKITG